MTRQRSPLAPQEYEGFDGDPVKEARFFNVETEPPFASASRWIFAACHTGGREEPWGQEQGHCVSGDTA